MVRPQKISDEQILAATREALLEHGPAVSIVTIAARLDVSGPALLKRFGSRQELLARALCPDGPPGWIVRLEAPVSEAELPVALAQVLGDAMEFFARLVPLLILVRTANVELRVLDDGPGDELRLALTNWIIASRGRVRRADPDPAAFVEAVLGAIESRCFHAYLRGKQISARQRSAWIRELVAGLWPRLAGSAQTSS